MQEDDLENGDERSETRQDNDTQPWDEVQAQGVLEQRITNLVITLNKVEHKLRSRINKKGILSSEKLGILDQTSTHHEDYWVGDIVWSRWPGEDAIELYPGWYEVKILHVYEDNTCNVEFFHDEGSPNAIVPFSQAPKK